MRSPTSGNAPRRLIGSGFLLRAGSKLVVVTNQHVVPSDLDTERGERIAVFSGQGDAAQQSFARLIKNDVVHDLAVLSYEGPSRPALRLEIATDVGPGESVAFTGFPIGAVLGLYPATHRGVVAAITPIARVADIGRELTATQLFRMRNPFNVYQLDAIAYPGNSGSAVYRASTGGVVGVINSVFVKQSRESILTDPSGIAYAIPAIHVQTLLEDLD